MSNVSNNSSENINSNNEKDEYMLLADYVAEYEKQNEKDLVNTTYLSEEQQDLLYNALDIFGGSEYDFGNIDETDLLNKSSENDDYEWKEHYKYFDAWGVQFPDTEDTTKDFCVMVIKGPARWKDEYDEDNLAIRSFDSEIVFTRITVRSNTQTEKDELHKLNAFLEKQQNS